MSIIATHGLALCSPAPQPGMDPHCTHLPCAVDASVHTALFRRGDRAHMPTCSAWAVPDPDPTHMSLARATLMRLPLGSPPALTWLVRARACNLQGPGCPVGMPSTGAAPCDGCPPGTTLLYDHCKKPAEPGGPGWTSVPLLVQGAEAAGAAGSIAPTTHLAHTRHFVFRGSKDTVYLDGCVACVRRGRWLPRCCPRAGWLPPAAGRPERAARRGGSTHALNLCVHARVRAAGP